MPSDRDKQAREAQRLLRQRRTQQAEGMGDNLWRFLYGTVDTVKPKVENVAGFLKGAVLGGSEVDPFQPKGTPPPDLRNLSPEAIGEIVGMAMGLPLLGKVGKAIPPRPGGDWKAAMNRANVQGYTQPVFHGTYNLDRRTLSTPIEEFNLDASKGFNLMDRVGVHAGTPRAAADRLSGQKGIPSFIDSLEDFDHYDTRDARQAQILPLIGKTENPLTDHKGQPFSEANLEAFLHRIAKTLGLGSESLPSKFESVDELNRRRQIQSQAVRQYLLNRGHDSIPYINDVEDPGSVSWIFLRPQNLRSRFAQFDPALKDSANLMAGLGGLAILNNAKEEK